MAGSSPLSSLILPSALSDIKAMNADATIRLILSLLLLTSPSQSVAVFASTCAVLGSAQKTSYQSLVPSIKNGRSMSILHFWPNSRTHTLHSWSQGANLTPASIQGSDSIPTTSHLGRDGTIHLQLGNPPAAVMCYQISNGL